MNKIIAEMQEKHTAESEGTKTQVEPGGIHTRLPVCSLSTSDPRELILPPEHVCDVCSGKPLGDSLPMNLTTAGH